MSLGQRKIKNLDEIYENRKKEFEPEGYVFDVSHKLAETFVGHCIILLQERSLYSNKIAEWSLSVLLKTVCVKFIGPDHFTFQYYIDRRKCSYEDVKIMIALNELIKAEDYINK